MEATPTTCFAAWPRPYSNASPTSCGSAIAFVEDGRLELGPEAGSGDGEEIRSPVTFAGAPVAELVVQRTEAADDEPFLERVATLISPYCLVGWDTQGDPVGRRLVGQPRRYGARRPIRVLVRMGAAALLPLPLLTL